MEMAAGGSLTSYVADKWQKAQALGLFLSEDEARYFFKVPVPHMMYRPASGTRPPALPCAGSGFSGLDASGWRGGPYPLRRTRAAPLCSNS